MGRPFALISVLLIAVILFSTYQASVQNPPAAPEQGPEIRSNTSTFQDLTDKAAQAAVDGEWTLCRYYIDQLQTEWDQIKPDSAHRLDTIIPVDQVLAQLHALALDQDQVGIIQATTQLTQAFSHLFSS